MYLLRKVNCIFCQDTKEYITEFHLPDEDASICPFCSEPDIQKAEQDILALIRLRIITNLEYKKWKKEI